MDHERPSGDGVPNFRLTGGLAVGEAVAAGAPGATVAAGAPGATVGPPQDARTIAAVSEAAATRAMNDRRFIVPSPE